ncbi:hypothetical protein [Edaphobacter bradus]|nr:hypothetical protein [Edaphobacter bradus]
MAPLNHRTATAARINIDLIAVAIALTLAALIRFNVLPPISF